MSDLPPESSVWTADERAAYLERVGIAHHDGGVTIERARVIADTQIRRERERRRG